MNADFKNKKIAVLGAALEGLTSAEYLVRHGAKVTILDKKPNEEIEKHIKFRGGENYLDNLEEYEMIVRSPGIKLNLPELEQARKKGVVITSQTKLFFDLCPAKIIGVTGTKGKGTTASLIYEMLKKDGKDAYLGGNIGKPPFTFLDTLTPQSWVVLELSSFQLQDLTKSPHIAVVLMVTQEHLQAFEDQNFHENIEEYIGAKRNILRFQNSGDLAVVNRDYPASLESDIHTHAKVFFVSREREVEEGCFIRDNKVILRLSREIKNEKLKMKNSEEETIDVKDILLPGKHNWENICAAVMVATLAGVSKKTIAHVLKTFKGLEHRLELVGEVGGVRYYDDSFSTTPETAIAAIEAFDKPEILILGGSSKGSDFTQLGRIISTTPNIKAIIGIGIEWPKIKSKIKNQIANIAFIEGCKNMKEIVLTAFDAADPGDVVLLSPACASFGMFTNYKERGEQFKREVNSLQNSL